MSACARAYAQQNTHAIGLKKAKGLVVAAVPTLLVHGIWDSAPRLEPLRQGLLARGVAEVVSLSLTPNNGSAPIPVLAEQVQNASIRLAARFDLVGFSMGALVSRYFLQRLGGRLRVRRFISISGPHHGTLTAYALPLAGVRDMRPKSALLKDLESDDDPWGAASVHTVSTPFDLMIVPSRSSQLPGSRSHREFPVKMHRFMISDARVLDHVAQVLLATE
jgi:triacylglycerol lipase